MDRVSAEQQPNTYVAWHCNSLDGFRKAVEKNDSILTSFEPNGRRFNRKATEDKRYIALQEFGRSSEGG